jgi:hypothetical protein
VPVWKASPHGTTSKEQSLLKKRYKTAYSGHGLLAGESFSRVRERQFHEKRLYGFAYDGRGIANGKQRETTKVGRRISFEDGQLGFFH